MCGKNPYMLWEFVTYASYRMRSRCRSSIYRRSTSSILGVATIIMSILVIPIILSDQFLQR